MELPFGSPMLMMGFTKDGQLNPALVADRDKRFNVSTTEKRKQPEDIPMPKVVEGANTCEKGEVRQLQMANHYQTPEHQH